MNKRIIEIAVQSGFDLKTAESQHNGHILPKSLDCFSRGVIRECAANLRNHGYDDAAEQLEKHFGVKNE